MWHITRDVPNLSNRDNAVNGTRQPITFHPTRWLALVALYLGTLVTASLFVSGNLRAQSPNLLSNSGFESGTTGWTPSSNPAFTFGVTTTTAHGGTQSALLTSNGSTVSRDISQIVTGIVGGSRYKLTGYGYILDATVVELYLLLTWYESADCSGTELPGPVESPSMTTRGAFQLLTTAASTAPTNAHCARVRAVIVPGTTALARAMFDDIAFGLDSPTCTPTATGTTTLTVTAVSTNAPTLTRTATATVTPLKLMIEEVVYDGTQSEEGDEFVCIYNPNPFAVSLDGYKIGDEETAGGNEGMYRFLAGSSIAADGIVIVGRNSAKFRARFGYDADYELTTTGSFSDTLNIPNLAKHTAWSGGSFELANSGDEVLLLGSNDQVVDWVAWKDGDFARLGLAGSATASEPQSLQRYGTTDTNSMTFDFMHGSPNPRGRSVAPAAPSPPAPAQMPNGMLAFWGDLHAHSTVSDGSGPPRQIFAEARAAGLHFAALTDHDTDMTATSWTELGNAATAATVDNAFIAFRGFEYSHTTQGHLSVLNSDTYISHRDAAYDTFDKVYIWLKNRIC